MKVDKEFRWTLSCEGILVEVAQCQVLSDVPNRLNSSSALLGLLATLQATQVCCGNAVSEFQLLVDARGGEFKDSTGNKYTHAMILHHAAFNW